MFSSCLGPRLVHGAQELPVIGRGAHSFGNFGNGPGAQRAGAESDRSSFWLRAWGFSERNPDTEAFYVREVDGLDSLLSQGS